MSRLRRRFGLDEGEGRAAGLAFLSFFYLLAAYFILRPLREEAGVAGGVEELSRLFLGTFLGMLVATPLYALLVSRWSRPRIVAIAFRFFIANILIFAALRLDDGLWVYGSRVFYCWLSVFNLFVVSLFWSSLLDAFRPEQCRRLFGIIAAGGSLGAITGSLVTDIGIGSLGPAPLFLAPALLLEGARAALVRATEAATAARDEASADEETTPTAEVPRVDYLAGARRLTESPLLTSIAIFILLMTVSSTFVYFEQANIVKSTWPDDPVARTRFFSRLNLGVQILTLVFQLALTGRIVRRLGPGAALVVLPLISIAGFAALGSSLAMLAGSAVTIGVLAAFQIFAQATSRGLISPTRQMLFAPLDREGRYQAKAFIDTIVYRGGDMMTAMVFEDLKHRGLGLATMAFLGLPICLLWLGVARSIARRARADEATPPLSAASDARG